MEKTECYKCDTGIDAPIGVVHPLCDQCASEFADWFELALKGKA